MSRYFDFFGIAAPPREADAILIVDPDAVPAVPLGLNRSSRFLGRIQSWKGSRRCLVRVNLITSIRPPECLRRASFC